MGVSEGSRTSERTSGDDGAHPGRRRAASHNRPRTAAPKKPLLVDVIATSSDLQQDPPIATTVGSPGSRATCSLTPTQAASY